MRPWPRPTTPPTACPPGSGQRKEAGSSPWHNSCARAWSGPTPTTGSTRPARSAGIRNPGSGGRAAGPAWPRTSMPDRRRAKPRTGQDGKASASQAQGPQASGGSGGSPPRASTESGLGRPAARASRAKSPKPKAADGQADSVSTGGRVRPRASQPAKLAEAAPAPAADGAAGRETRSRLDVRKTYKLFIGGAFPRSESGRSYPVAGPDGTLL